MYRELRWRRPPKSTTVRRGTIRRCRCIDKHEQVTFDRSHFANYGDFSLDFETVYYVERPEYNVYMDVQQAIYLDIHRSFEDRGIEFAYPTQTVFLERS